MNKDAFNNMFTELYLPVIVCANNPELAVIYMNVRAGLLFSPSYSTDQLKNEQSSLGCLQDILHFKTPAEYLAFCQMLNSTGRIDDYQSELITFDAKMIPVTIAGNRIQAEDSKGFFVFYLVNKENQENPINFGTQLSAIINAAFLPEDVDSSINLVLALAGSQADVSRAYIFEEISSTMTRNSYEWCAEGIEPVIQDLQSLPKADYNYDTIVNSGMFITDDIRGLPDSDRKILETQGIKSVAIISFRDDQSRPIGYIGFDDCRKYRQWGSDEIQFLKSISALLSNLIKRRNAEQAAQHFINIMQIISDNSEDLVYANSLDDYTIKFVNKSMARAFQMQPEEMLGQICWKIVQQNQTGPCDFCPIPKIPFSPGEDRSKVYEWEHKNTLTQKTYMAKNNIVRWVDGKFVHIQSLIDISKRIEYEEQLRQLASMDTMTGVHNREWGVRTLMDKLYHSNQSGSLCFLDMDGLKITNDRYGHAAGDSFLIETIKIIKKHLSYDDFVCRWGGDEFILLLNSNTDLAEKTIKRMQKEMEKYNQEKQEVYKLSFSYGVVPFIPSPNASLDALVTLADELMYKNKMAKRGVSTNRRKTDLPAKKPR